MMDAKEFIGYMDGIDILMHYGVKRRSGRYPWGSGDSPYQHSGDFLSRVDELKKQGKTEKEIADEMQISVKELRTASSLAKHQRRATMREQAITMREDGKTLQEIADALGMKNESSVRSLLDDKTADNKSKAQKTAEILKEQLAVKGMIDIGAGAEIELGVSREVLDEASYILGIEGYQVYGVGIPQITNVGKQTNTMVLANPDIEYGYVYNHMGDIGNASLDGMYTSTDGGETFRKLQYPASLDSSRIDICYGDQGGTLKDGVIEIRPGVSDLDLGQSHYAQVRILVDDTHYLKGMAMYADDLPDGIDIRFNTNKSSSTPKMDTMKKIKNDDPDNPFGAYIKANGQSYYIDADGNEKLSPINKLREEGDWDAQSRTLSSQFLSKQPMKLINQQLDATYKDYESQYNEIMSLTNPTIKRELLADFANTVDGAQNHLKAAALPRQSNQVLLPLDCMKDNEIYAPNYKNGEQVALIRYPHGGTFEIPILTVNNKNKKAIDILGTNIKDAVGINSKVAERLSGADFDGDTATVIPISRNSNIKSTPPLSGLVGFDPKTSYESHIDISTGKRVNKYGDEIKVMSSKEKQKEMGTVSNLITDMTIKGAPLSEIERAVKHSMVVIDAEKHKLDYKQSEKDNGIKELREKWQSRIDISTGETKSGGASTLISRKGQEVRVPERKGSGIINKETGEVTYKESGRTYVDKKGNTVQATTKIPLISSTSDARTLSTGTQQENAYADYVNKLKSLENKARKSMFDSNGDKIALTYNAEAKKTYSNEVNSLNSKLNNAAKNAPKEREAQRIANTKIKAMKQDNPELKNDKKELKKQSQIAISEARYIVGASSKNSKINITDKEWEAIQAGAISDSKLTKIYKYSDKDRVKQLAMPNNSNSLSTNQINKIKSMSNNGYTNSEIAEALNISTSTVFNYID